MIILNTDIKGANLLNYDSLIISNGIHKNEIKKMELKKHQNHMKQFVIIFNQN